MLKISNMATISPELETNLKKSFTEAMKDEKFQRLISKLRIKEDILIRYTSELEDSAIEYDHCLHCKSLLECQNKIEGYAYIPTCKSDHIEFNYRSCKYQEKMLKETSFLKNVYYVDIPENIKIARMKDIYTDDKARYDVIKYLKKFINDPTTKGLYLHGNFGCGKTFLVTAAFNELAKKNIRSAIIFWPSFLKKLKSSFDSDFSEIFEKVKKIPVLLIDDIGAENMTPWARDEILCPILQYRMEESLSTFFTSNLNINELEVHLSLSKEGVDTVKAKRIISRIEQLTTDSEMISRNLRNK
jgi:primosomal protein DnaI